MDRTKLKIIIEKYGKEPQVDMCIEEMSELTKALLKERRGKGNIKDIAEEIADVQIMLEQMKWIFEIEDDEINEIIDYKLNRTLERIRESE